MNIRAASLIWIFSSLMILQGCGYHNPYTRGADQDQQNPVIYLSVWNNRTNELGLENLIFQSTADQLRQIRYLEITTDLNRADYILTGTVLRVDYPASAFSVTETATTLNARTEVEYRLTDRVSGKTLWQTTETIRGDDYPVGLDSATDTIPDAIRTQSNKKTALGSIAAEISEHIYLRITDTLTNTAGPVN